MNITVYKDYSKYTSRLFLKKKIKEGTSGEYAYFMYNDYSHDGYSNWPLRVATLSVSLVNANEPGPTIRYPVYHLT